MNDDMFNEEQLDYMQFLNSLPPEEKCPCGWYQLKDIDSCTRCSASARQREEEDWGW